MKLTKYLLPRPCRIVGYVTLPIFLLWALYFRLLSGMYDLMGSFFRGQGQDAISVRWSDYVKRYEQDFKGYYLLFGQMGSSWLDELVVFGVILSVIFIAFSREKIEDEYIRKIRMESLVWAFVVDALLISVATFTLFRMNYIAFMAVNFYLLIILFVFKFRIALLCAKKQVADEK